MMLARHQHTSRRCTDRRTRIETSQPEPPRSHPVQTGSLDQLLPVTAQLAVTQVIRKNYDNRWPSTGMLSNSRLPLENQRENKKKQLPKSHRTPPTAPPDRETALKLNAHLAPPSSSRRIGHASLPPSGIRPQAVKSLSRTARITPNPPFNLPCHTNSPVLRLE